MVRHILVASDGSRLSARAVRVAVRLAKTLGARLSGLHVVAAYAPAGARGMQIGALRGFRRAVRLEGERVLAAFRREARACGVAAEASSVVGGEPWRAILRTARARRCDLIVMASHGRSGLAGLVLGSETTKVLTHSRIPVLVCR
jgi:nucleotide-binding universal stress UspA family protein